MSVINKKPYIKSVLEDLSKENLAKFLQLIDGSVQKPIFRSFINEDALIGETDEDNVQYCVLEVKDNVFSGYLLYSEHYISFVSFFNKDTQPLKLLKLDITNKTYEVVEEYLDIDELRFEASECDETAEIIAAVNKAIEDGDIQAGVEVKGNDASSSVTDGALEKLTIGEDTYDVLSAEKGLAPAYSSSSTYAVGDIVSHDNKVYKCTTAIAVAEAWTAGHWQLGTIAELVLGMINVGY